MKEEGARNVLTYICNRFSQFSPHAEYKAGTLRISTGVVFSEVEYGQSTSTESVVTRSRRQRVLSWTEQALNPAQTSCALVYAVRRCGSGVHYFPRSEIISSTSRAL